MKDINLKDFILSFYNYNLRDIVLYDYNDEILVMCEAETLRQYFRVHDINVNVLSFDFSCNANGYLIVWLSYDIYNEDHKKDINDFVSNFEDFNTKRRILKDIAQNV